MSATGPFRATDDNPVPGCLGDDGVPEGEGSGDAGPMGARMLKLNTRPIYFESDTEYLIHARKRPSVWCTTRVPPRPVARPVQNTGSSEC